MRIKVWLKIADSDIYIEDELEIPNLENESREIRPIICADYLNAWAQEMIETGYQESEKRDI